MDTTDPGIGRRERLKTRTRDALIAAAQRLFAERGFTGTSVTDITDAADVSERTFYRYFAAKEDLLLIGIETVLGEAESRLRARPVDEPPLAAIRASVVGLVRDRTAANPAGGLGAQLDPAVVRALANRIAVVAMDWERQFALVIAERLRFAGSTAGEADLALRSAVIATAAMSACRSALRVLREHPHNDRSLSQLLADAFDTLETGLN